ncbi:hypothetical protein FRX31_005398 [Thalictrum thalictroides]|uniref:Uncharacterized protein n=1 Tax=Thalictrum thalictroides TaxID=46969 RepID=A0A7J6X831_THATH|nr:hypothetical protein FRX31_005398 [Thalictrum thalictroides]
MYVDEGNCSTLSVSCDEDVFGEEIVGELDEMIVVLVGVVGSSEISSESGFGERFGREVEAGDLLGVKVFSWDER